MLKSKPKFKRTKSSGSASTIANIKRLRREHKKDKKDEREKLRDRLSKAMAEAIKLRIDKPEMKRFCALAMEKLPKRKIVDPHKNLTAAVVAIVTCAKSENALKLAWKKARALDYLYDTLGVQPKDMPAKIVDLKGFEAVAKLAAKETPRRSKPGSVSKNNLKSMALSKKESDGKVTRHIDEDDEDDLFNSEAHQKSDDRLTTISVQIRTTELNTLVAVKPRRRIKMICVRLDRDNGDEVIAEVLKVHAVKK